MDKFTVSSVIAVCIYTSAGSKMVFDQMKLLKTYKAKIDPTLPVLPQEWGIGPSNLLSVIPVTRRLNKITFSKYPEDPVLDKLARKVRYDLLAMVCLLFLLIIFFP